MRQEFGEPDVIQVRKEFDSPENARIWESKKFKHNNDGLICGNTASTFKPGHEPWSEVTRNKRAQTLLSKIERSEKFGSAKGKRWFHNSAEETFYGKLGTEPHGFSLGRRTKFPR